jgi:hypothetical protein
VPEDAHEFLGFIEVVPDTLRKVLLVAFIEFSLDADDEEDGEDDLIG